MHLRAIQNQEAIDSSHYFPNMEQGVLYLATALAGEVGEFCNDAKKWARGSITKEELKERSTGELADILIYLVMCADHLEIDLEQAWEAKKRYNNERYERSSART